MTMDLTARRAEVEAELAELQRKRGVALLEGREFPAVARISRLLNEMDGLVEAEGVAADREREQAEARRMVRLAELRQELATLEEQRLEAIDLAEMAARNMVDAVNRALEINARMVKVAHLISGGPCPGPMMPTEIVNRLSNRMSGVFARLKGVSIGQFGQFQWHATGLFPHTDNWPEKERQALSPHLKPLIAGAQPKPEEPHLMITKENTNVIDLGNRKPD